VVEGQGTDAETSGGESGSGADESGASAGADEMPISETAQSAPTDEEQNKAAPGQ